MGHDQYLKLTSPLVRQAQSGSLRLLPNPAQARIGKAVAQYPISYQPRGLIRYRIFTVPYSLSVLRFLQVPSKAGKGNGCIAQW